MRLVSRCLLLGALVAMLASPAVAGEPQKPFIFDLNDPEFDGEDSIWWSEQCDFPVTAELSGHIIYHNAKRGAVMSITVYHTTEILRSASGTYRLHDIGPDIEYIRGGVSYLALVGRSITGSGVIGRTVINLDTGEVDWNGRLVGDEVLGDFVAPICRALAPPAQG